MTATNLRKHGVHRLESSNEEVYKDSPEHSTQSTGVIRKRFLLHLQRHFCIVLYAQSVREFEWPPVDKYRSFAILQNERKMSVHIFQ